MSSDSASSEVTARVGTTFTRLCSRYPGYLAPADDEIIVKDQPYADYDSPIAVFPGYIADSDLKEDSEDGPVDYPPDGGDDDDDDSSDDEEEEEEHLALADSVVAPAVDLIPSSKETEPFETDEGEGRETSALPTPPSSTLISLSPPFVEERLARCLAIPALPLSPFPIVPYPYGSPNHVRAPQGFRAAMGRLRASSPSTYHPLHPSPLLPPLPLSLYLPPPVPTSLPLPSPPLPPLPTSLFIPPPVDHKEDIPKVELPRRKRLCLTALTSRYEVEESSTAAARPTEGHRAYYGFIGTLDAETRRQRAEEEEDTHDLYAVIEDAQDRQTRLSQRVNVLIEDREFHQETMLFIKQEALVFRNNMPPRRTSIAAARAAATVRAVAATAPMIAAVEQLIEARVSAALANHETLRNITNGVVVLSQWFKKMEPVFHISNCTVENQVKFATCSFFGNALTWWNFHMKTVTQDVAYAMDWKTLKKMMIVKYCPMGEIKKLEIKLWNLKESDEVERYVGGLPDMIRGNVMSYQPKTMEKAIEFANDQMDQNVLTIAKRQAEQKRKLEFNAGNNQGSSGPNGNNNNRGNSGTTQNAGTCYECGVQGHFKGDFPKLKNKNCGNQGGNVNAPAKVYVVGNARTKPDSNVVTGTFLLNNRYDSILFDTGANRSFITTAFSSLIDITPTTLNHYYDVELADGKVIRINTIIRGCTLNFLDHLFNIDLMPIELGSFDVIIGMDWLSKYHVVIVYAEKIIHIPWGNETLIVHSDGRNQGNETRLNIILCNPTLTMATISKLDSTREDKGKMIIAEAEMTAISDVRPIHCNKKMKAVVCTGHLITNLSYIQKTNNPITKNYTKQGTLIQANMDVKDADYFDQLLQHRKAYGISCFSREQTGLWERTLDNPTSLIFQFCFLQRVPARTNVNHTILTDYASRIQAVSRIYTSGDATTNRTRRRVIDIQNLRIFNYDVQMFNHQTVFYNRKTFNFEGDTKRWQSNNDTDGKDVIELLTLTINPDGAIYDHAYYGP
nr:hypothetical protein [Tanacetum cinerariifolium]